MAKNEAGRARRTLVNDCASCGGRGWYTDAARPLEGAVACACGGGAHLSFARLGRRIGVDGRVLARVDVLVPGVHKVSCVRVLDAIWRAGLIPARGAA